MVALITFTWSLHDPLKMGRHSPNGVADLFLIRVMETLGTSVFLGFSSVKLLRSLGALDPLGQRTQWKRSVRNSSVGICSASRGDLSTCNNCSQELPENIQVLCGSTIHSCKPQAVFQCQVTLECFDLLVLSRECDMTRVNHTGGFLYPGNPQVLSIHKHII